MGEGPFIPSFLALRSSAKLRKLCADLGIERPQAVGHLHLLWWWVFEQSPTGDVSKFDADDLAWAAEWTGDPAELVGAMHARGFLEELADGRVVIHDWWDGGGKLTAAKEASAKANHERWHVQQGKASPTCHYCNPLRPDSDRTPTGLHRDSETDSKGEERRGEERTTTSSPSATVEAEFAEFYAAYPRKVGRRAARAAFEKAIERAPAEKIITAAKAYAADPNQPADRTKIPHPTTWLNQDRWDDEPLPPRIDERADREPLYLRPVEVGP